MVAAIYRLQKFEVEGINERGVEHARYIQYTGIETYFFCKMGQNKQTFRCVSNDQRLPTIYKRHETSRTLFTPSCRDDFWPKPCGCRNLLKLSWIYLPLYVSRAELWGIQLCCAENIEMAWQVEEMILIVGNYCKMAALGTIWTRCNNIYCTITLN